MPFTAKNATTSARELLIERSRYEARIIGEMAGERPNAIETKKIKHFLLDEKMLYGRIDQFNDAVVLKHPFVKRIGTSKISAQDFVVDAFAAVKERFAAGIKWGQAKGNLPVFSALEAKKGYSDPMRDYRKYKKILSDRFIYNFIASESMRAEIHDFTSFMPFFSRFLLSAASNVPVTKSAFLVSSLVSPLSSGLMVEIYDGSYSDDKLKHEMFYKQKDFEFFRNVAYGNGFVIDKHIPWRMVADINSPNMKKHLSRYYAPGTNSSFIFSYAYDKAHMDGVSDLMELAKFTYNSFVAEYPATQLNKCSHVKVVRRRMATHVTPGMLGWLRLYIEIRNLETGLFYDAGTIESIFMDVRDIFYKLDKTKTMGYINRKFNSVEHFGGSLFYDMTRRKIAKDPESEESDVGESILRSVQLTRFPTY